MVETLSQINVKNGIKDLWIFDLDGTLWMENSHVAIVEQFLGWRKYTNFFSRVYGKFFFKKYYADLCDDYSKIKSEYIKKEFHPHIQNEVINILNQAKSKSDDVYILSNAPKEIIEFAEEMFKIKGFRAPIGEKGKVLQELFTSWDRLSVVTDNLTDISLIELSDKTYFFVAKNRYKGTMKKLNRYLEKTDVICKGER